MRILYIDQYFSTRAGNSGTRSYEFARRFAAAGHEVTLITTASDYSNLAGQQPWVRRQKIEGIDVISFRIEYAQRMSYARRGISFLLFMIASTAAGVFLRRHDVIFASSTPLSVGVTGAIISWFRGSTFVFEVRDLWPRAPIEFGIIRNRAAQAVLLAVEAWIYRRADRINALSPGMAEGVAQRGVAKEKISMIPNACDLDLAPARVDHAEVRQRYGLTPDCFLIAYAGALGLTNDLAELLRVAEAVRKKAPSRIHFLILGKGSEEENLRSEAARLGLDNMTFAGSVSRSEAAEAIAAADLCVTCFGSLPILQMNSPNKMFDYLSAGRAQMVNVPGWIRDIVEGGGAGFFWPHGSPEIAAEKIIELSADRARLEEMGVAALRIARERFERGLLAGRLLAVFDETMRAPARGLPILAQGLFDRTAALLGLMILSPFFLAVRIAVKKEDGGPVFYRPVRVGLAGRTFKMFKFRTMVVGADKMGLGLNVSGSDERITRVGRFLREWSLDELPQILNVLLGDMRLVGPRPALPDHTAKYGEEQAERLRVRPGLTGWAQVNGRNALSWEQKLEFDSWYARHRSLPLDLRILWRTVAVVIRREGLYEKDAGLEDPFNRFEK